MAHSKRTIGFLEQRNILYAMLTKIIKNTYGCAEHYRCATELCLISMFSQAFYIIIDHGSAHQEIEES